MELQEKLKHLQEKALSYDVPDDARENVCRRIVLGNLADGSIEKEFVEYLLSYLSQGECDLASMFCQIPNPKTYCQLASYFFAYKYDLRIGNKRNIFSPPYTNA